MDVYIFDRYSTSDARLQFLATRMHIHIYAVRCWKELTREGQEGMSFVGPSIPTLGAFVYIPDATLLTE